MNGSEQSQLGPEELSRLLHAAVEPIRPSPEAYRQIKAGVERRRRWRAPLFAAGGAVLAGLAVLGVLLLRPGASSSSSRVVEPPPALGRSSLNSGSPGPGGAVSSNGSTTVGSSGPGASQSATEPGITPTVDPTSNVPSSTSPPGSEGNSPTRPPLLGERPAIAGDVDGDGKADTVRLNGATVEVTRSRGGTEVAKLPTGATATRWAGFDLDGDGYSELVVQTGSASGVDTYAVLRFMAPGDISVLDNNGSTSPVTAGGTSSGSTTTSTGFACSNTGIRQVVGTSTDGGANYDVTVTMLAVTIDGLTQFGTPSTGALPATSATPSFSARCGDWSK